MGKKFFWDDETSYDSRGRSGCRTVVLYKKRKNSVGEKVFDPIAWWSYSTFLSSRLAEFRVERRIIKLVKLYNAEPLPDDVS